MAGARKDLAGFRDAFQVRDWLLRAETEARETRELLRLRRRAEPQDEPHVQS